MGMKRSVEWKWRCSCEIEVLVSVLCFNSSAALTKQLLFVPGAFAGRWAPSTTKFPFPGLLSPQRRTHRAICPCKLSQKSLSLSWWRASLHWLLSPSNNWNLSVHEASGRTIHKDLVFNHLYYTCKNKKKKSQVTPFTQVRGDLKTLRAFPAVWIFVFLLSLGRVVGF